MLLDLKDGGPPVDVPDGFTLDRVRLAVENGERHKHEIYIAKIARGEAMVRGGYNIADLVEHHGFTHREAQESMSRVPLADRGLGKPAPAVPTRHSRARRNNWAYG